MNLELFLISLIAIILVSLIAYGLAPKRKELSAERARRNFRKIFPHSDVRDVILSRCRRHAVLRLADDPLSLGLVTLLGDRVVCRIISRGDGTAVGFSDTAITVTMPDFTFPKLRILRHKDNSMDLDACFAPWLEGSPHAA